MWQLHIRRSALIHPGTTAEVHSASIPAITSVKATGLRGARMARRVYTETDQAFIAVCLQANAGNIRKTARETGVPVSTVRDFRDKWEAEGYPEPVEGELPAVRRTFIEDAKEVRQLMIERLREKVERGEVTARDLISGIKELTDKINVMEGMATSRTEVVQSLPDARELAAELAAFIDRTVDDAVERANAIDADWEEDQPLQLVVSNP